MYGHIHCVVRDLVISQFGQETWYTILKEAGLDDRDHFMLFYHYRDDFVLNLVQAASKCLNLTIETVLEVFGDYFLLHCLRYGYDDMLRTLGSDITSFIQNLDSLHSLLALTYDKIVAPSFRCETNKDGSLTLHYYSARTGLHPLVKGVLKAVAREIFDQEVQVVLLSEHAEELDEDRVQNHVVFLVTIVKQNQLTDEYQTVQETEEDLHPIVVPQLPPVALTKAEFVSIFPYHMIFDEALVLRQFGSSIAKLSPVPLLEGMCMSSSFHILYPRMSFTAANIKRFINAIFVIAVTSGDGKSEENSFSMKGQMICLKDSKLIIFIGSPRLTSLKEMKRMNVFMADIPLYDVTREMILLYQQRNAEIDITKKLDETTAELKRTSRELEMEKQKTERLLYQMLPQKVANQLKNGETVEAEKFEQVTVLFSDIVTFTDIASACTPMDIVRMLNDMYNRFDKKTNEHGVYKVETIGDAYMVVCGLPEKTDRHAQPVADFSLDMVEQARCVLSPATGKPLQIRVGIHTGPVVAGVVGVKMPRYCLFGDTVNTASRMESHGIPGRIHLSPSAFKALEGQGYGCKYRGDTIIKGKGCMKTYFLIGSQNHVISEPEDEFLHTPIIGQQDGDIEASIPGYKSQRDRSVLKSSCHDNKLKNDKTNTIDELYSPEKMEHTNNRTDEDHRHDSKTGTQDDAISIHDIPQDAVSVNDIQFPSTTPVYSSQDECCSRKISCGQMFRSQTLSDTNSQNNDKICPLYSKTCNIY